MQYLMYDDDQNQLNRLEMKVRGKTLKEMKRYPEPISTESFKI